ncbi:drug/metabolite transporter (DMT)-like permease [Paraburkholderia sp. WC7.3d]|uniref:DMT family transporter n=1 Tax=Paraburkholderia podalyriae TaxID=1938811 RepID=A0ABR7PQZ6_9BURK|nr:DMT family transporter [Paraburkholderia podalyriae]
MKSSKLYGTSLGIAGGVLLSTDALLIRLMHLEDAWEIVVMRGLLMWTAFVMIYYLVPRWRPWIGKPWVTRQNVWPTFFFAIASTTFVNAIAHGEVASVLVIISSTPFLSALLGRAFFSEPIDRAMLATATLAMSGVALVIDVGPRGGAFAANCFALATAVSMALAFLCSSRVEGGSVGLPSLGALVASLLVIVSQPALASKIPVLLISERAIWMLFEGAFVMPLSLGLLTLSARFIPPANTELFLLLETALAPLWIWIAFNERPALQVVAGGAVTVSAVLIHVVQVRQRSYLRVAGDC